MAVKSKKCSSEIINKDMEVTKTFGKAPGLSKSFPTPDRIPCANRKGERWHLGILNWQELVKL